MPGLVPGIHVFGYRGKKDVDGRDEPGHDEKATSRAWIQLTDFYCETVWTTLPTERVLPTGSFVSLTMASS
jgi:hypothetical protein